jgi:hypothetical protein
METAAHFCELHALAVCLDAVEFSQIGIDHHHQTWDPENFCSYLFHRRLTRPGKFVCNDGKNIKKTMVSVYHVFLNS